MIKSKTLAILFSVCCLVICSTLLRGADLTSEVKRFNSMPSLFINGKPASSLISYTAYPEDMEEFLKAGFTIVDISLPFDWVGPEKYDFVKTDEEMEKYLKQDPNLLVLPPSIPCRAGGGVMSFQMTSL